MGASPFLIGVNAAMPALGWLIVTPLLPRLQRKFGSRQLLMCFLCIAIFAMIGFQIWMNLWAWIPLRFLFGGSIGLLFRVIEFWINEISPEQKRGRNIGIYAVVFCVGLASGAALVPLTGSSGWLPHLSVCVLLMGGTIPLFGTRSSIPQIGAPPSHSFSSFALFLPLAMVGVLVAGMYESIPYSLMPIYTLKVGLSEDLASLTITAFTIGAAIAPIPLGILSDRMDRQKLLMICAGGSLIMVFLAPRALFSSELFLFSLMIWGGLSSGLYTVSLTIIGAHYNGANLAAANAVYGTIYAVGALAGPLFNGMAMDIWNPVGLLYGAATLYGSFLIFAFWQSTRQPQIQEG